MNSAPVLNITQLTVALIRTERFQLVGLCTSLHIFNFQAFDGLGIGDDSSYLCPRTYVRTHRYVLDIHTTQHYATPPSTL